MAISPKTRGLLQLIRFDKPIGTLLLLWPALWALWIAAQGVPDSTLLAIFLAGTFLTRSAGCIINDLADRNLDGGVARTHQRPLVTGAITVRAAVTLGVALMLLAFILVLFTNRLTVILAIAAVILVASYPFMKRYMPLPQLVLGAAFSWSIPMAFAAQSGALPPTLWLVYLGNLLWTMAYDTAYAMVDREDDLKIGIKSAAILFGQYDRVMIALLQTSSLICLYFAGQAFGLGLYYNASLVVSAVLFGYQQYLIRKRKPDACFRAFLNNNWVGMAIFVGIALNYLTDAA